MTRARSAAARPTAASVCITSISRSFSPCRTWEPRFWSSKEPQPWSIDHAHLISGFDGLLRVSTSHTLEICIPKLDQHVGQKKNVLYQGHENGSFEKIVMEKFLVFGVAVVLIAFLFLGGGLFGHYRLEPVRSAIQAYSFFVHTDVEGKTPKQKIENALGQVPHDHLAERPSTKSKMLPPIAKSTFRGCRIGACVRLSLLATTGHQD